LLGTKRARSGGELLLEHELLLEDVGKKPGGKLLELEQLLEEELLLELELNGDKPCSPFF
jgi:hypothetical protein